MPLIIICWKRLRVYFNGESAFEMGHVEILSLLYKFYVPHVKTRCHSNRCQSTTYFFEEKTNYDKRHGTFKIQNRHVIFESSSKIWRKIMICMGYDYLIRYSTVPYRTVLLLKFWKQICIEQYINTYDRILTFITLQCSLKQIFTYCRTLQILRFF